MKADGIRDAATLILVRDPATRPRVLMGQRGAGAAFMPSRFVFPGGALDADDSTVPLVRPLAEPCASRLEEEGESGIGPGLAAAAIRELWEETGMAIGVSGTWKTEPPESWRDYADAGYAPDPEGLHFVFRAITPPGRTRRFDARFFLADAELIDSDPDDFGRASGELSRLQWIEIERVVEFRLPFITEVVLAEVAEALPDLRPPPTVPFFDNSGEESLFRHLGSGDAPYRQVRG